MRMNGASKAAWSAARNGATVWIGGTKSDGGVGSTVAGSLPKMSSTTESSSDWRTVSPIDIFVTRTGRSTVWAWFDVRRKTWPGRSS